jgi:hypothetical protein
MQEAEKILLDNFVEYFTLAENAYKMKKYNGATTLFFKAIVARIDLVLLRKTGKTPSSHTDRFAILRDINKELYEIADRDFPFYQDSYTLRMDKEAATLLKEDAERVKNIGEGKES